MRLARRAQGFTLLELMIVVVIIGILAAIAIPQYKQHVIKTGRKVAQADLESAASAMALYRSQNTDYQNAVLGPTSATSVNVFRNWSPNGTQSAALYDLVFANDTTTNNSAGAAQKFTIYAKPRSGRQAGDGALGIDQAGNKCWKKSNDTTCTIGTDPSW